MATLLQQITNAGITDSLSFDQRNKVRVFNNANILIFFISTFYFSVSIGFGFYWSMIVTFYSMCSNLLSFLLVRKGHYRAAFHFTMWYGFIFITACSVLFGEMSNAYYYFLFMPVVCNIFFDRRRTAIAYFLASAVLMIANVVYIDQVKPYYDLADWMRYFIYPNILFLALLIFLGVRLFKRENREYAAQIEEQREALEEKNTEITHSINYAKRIQSALIPSEAAFAKIFPESFVLFQPKDIVSGDFYWISETDDRLFYATADCTGHGVPGGFMTMLGSSFLDEIVNEKKVTQPAEVLNVLRDRIIQTLKQTGTVGENKDGMDIVFCRLDKKTNVLHYAAANNALYLLRQNELLEFKADKQPCGFYHELKPFTPRELPLQPGDCIYTCTDGYSDQFGGPQGKKLKYRQLKELLAKTGSLPMQEQKEQLQKAFTDWKGNLEQVDDVLLIGVKIR